MEELGLFVRLGGYLVGEVSPIKSLRHGRRRKKNAMRCFAIRKTRVHHFTWT